MTIGIEFFTPDGYRQIDENNPPYVVVDKGTISVFDWNANYEDEGETDEFLGNYDAEIGLGTIYAETPIIAMRGADGEARLLPQLTVSFTATETRLTFTTYEVSQIDYIVLLPSTLVTPTLPANAGNYGLIIVDENENTIIDSRWEDLVAIKSVLDFPTNFADGRNYINVPYLDVNIDEPGVFFALHTKGQNSALNYVSGGEAEGLGRPIEYYGGGDYAPSLKHFADANPPYVRLTMVKYFLGLTTNNYSSAGDQHSGEATGGTISVIRYLNF